MSKNYFLRGISICALLLIFNPFNGFGQVGIGTTTPNANAKLDISSTPAAPGGLLLPRVALTGTNSFAPLTAHVAGMTVYNTATVAGVNGVSPGYYYNDGAIWVRIAGSTPTNNNWQLTGNAGTTPGTNFIGTTDNVTFQVKTNNAPRFDFTEDGRLRSYNDGSAALPTYSWNGAASGQNMGMFRPGAGILGFSTGGLERFRIPSANQVFAMSDGTAALPFYSWSAGANMGMYRIAANTLGFSTASAERMRIAASGDIAVGNAAPGAKFHVALNQNTRPGIYSEITISNSNWSGGEFYNPNTTNGAGVTGTGFYGVNGSTTNYFDGWAGYFDGDLGVIGNGYAAGQFYSLSDRRVKTNFQKIENGLELILKLNPQKYEKNIHINNEIERIGKLNGTNNSTTPFLEFGLIAQEVEILLPELVSSKKLNIKGSGLTDLKSVNYTGLIPILIEAIQEQQHLIQSQEERIANLENLVQQMLDKK